MEYKVYGKHKQAAQRPIYGKGGGGAQAEEERHNGHQVCHHLAHSGALLRGISRSLLGFGLFALDIPRVKELKPRSQYGEYKHTVVISGIGIGQGRGKLIVFGYASLVESRLFLLGHGAIVVGIKAQLLIFFKCLRIVTEINQALDIRNIEKLLGGHNDGRKTVVGLPDVVYPKEFGVQECFTDLGCGIGLLSCRDIVIHFQEHFYVLFITPEAESGDEAEKEGDCEQHGQTAAEHADAVFFHELGLFKLNFARIVFIAFLKLLYAGLYGLHFCSGLTLFDIGIKHYKTQYKRAYEYGQKYIV